MVNRILSCLFVFFQVYFPNLHGQGITFQKTIGGNSFDFGVDVIELSNKDYCVLSSSSSYSTSNDMLIWIVDSMGDYKHHFLIGQNDVESSCSIKAKNDTLFILGTSLSPGSGNYDILFSSFLSNGTQLFEKRFDYANWEIATSFTFTSDKGFLISGNTSIDEFNQSDGFLLKLDKEGEVDFYRNYGNSGIDSLGAVIELEESFFTIGTFSDPVTNFKDIWIIKVDSSNGNILNEAFLGGSFDDLGQSILLTSLGEIIVGGVSNSFFNAGNNFNYYFQKLDHDLNLLWPLAQTSNNTFDWLSIRSMSILPNDEILFFATNNISADKDFIVFKLNNQGYFNGGTSFGTYGNEFGGKLVYTSDSGFIFCGTTNGFWPGLDNIYLQKNSSDFLFNPAPDFEVGIEKKPNDISQNFIFPNPATEKIFLTGINRFSRLEILNIQGQLLMDVLLTGDLMAQQDGISIDVASLSEGIYFLKTYDALLKKDSFHKFLILDR